MSIVKNEGVLRAAFLTLLESKGLKSPDARPLYAYRFARADYDQVGRILRQAGPSAALDRDGAALVVAYVAEWFRRDRSGGHWDWIRPLRSIGYDYGPYARIQYRDIENLVSSGLAAWRRPQPTGGERLLAIVSEAGFPVASVREDPRIASWLKNAVRAAERGYSVRDSVAAEAWRVSERLAFALFEPAVGLCENIVELRACLPQDQQRGSDAVDWLDQMRPHWRDDLPFDIEGEDVRTMVEEIIQLRDSSIAALDVKRTLTKSADGWHARASLNLSGNIDLRRFSPSVVEAVQSARRLRVFPRPPFCDEAIAVAAIETIEADDVSIHELRPLVTTFEAPLTLVSDARILIQTGNSTVCEFVAPGGEALLDPIIALQIEQTSEDGHPSRLRVLGPSPAQTTRPTLVLAVLSKHLDLVSFSDGYCDLGGCVGSDHRIVSFRGTARATIGGTTWTWRTSAERDADGRLLLVGSLVPNVREPVFLGFPQVWVERENHISSPKGDSLHWRPRGRGSWKAIAKSSPWGDVDLAVIEKGAPRYVTSASIVPPSFRIELDRRRRELEIVDAETRMVGAQAARNLTVRLEGGRAIVALGPATKGAKIALNLKWDAETQITFADPSHELRILDEDDCLSPLRATISVDALKRLRLVAPQQTSLCIELRANDVKHISISRVVVGEVPLSAFSDAIIQLLGSSESLDASARLSAVGASDFIADIHWYDEEVDLFDAPPPNAFAALGILHRLDLRSYSLTHPTAAAVEIEGPATQSALRSKLSTLLPPGPWLVYGRRRQGSKIRPRVVPVAAGRSAEATALSRAIAVESVDIRQQAILECYSHADAFSASELRAVIDLLMISKKEGVPISSIDALKLLPHRPALAVKVLAACDSLVERAALLEIQRELPFLWCSTLIDDWVRAFSLRMNDLAERLSSIGVDRGAAIRSLDSALGDVVNLRPELAGHAKVTFLVCATAEASRLKKAIDGRVFRSQFVRRNGVRWEIDRLVARHDEGMVPPRDMFNSGSLSTIQSYYEPYADEFSEIIAAPLLIADYASGRAMLDQSELRRSRNAWLYDPEYFEAVVPLGVDAMLTDAAAGSKRVQA